MTRVWLRARRPELLMAAAAAAVMGWDLGRPALWLDESASVVATQRPWPHLWLLLDGPDAPLVPYYAVLKVLTTSTRTLAPSVEVLYRWPSAAAVVLSCTLLIGWLRRFASLRLVSLTGVMLLLSGGLSRYGQEARAYGVTMLLAVVATITWTRLARDPARRWMAAYALAVACLAVMQPLAASLVAAHLVAAVTAAAPDRARRVLRTVIGAGAGLLIAAPQALLAMDDGRGATGFPSLTARHLLSAFVRLFTTSPHPWLDAGPVLLLACLGLAGTCWPERFGWRGPSGAPDPFAHRVVTAWAVVPPVVLLPAVIARPNLLIGRYLLFVVPAWAVLAGAGASGVMHLAARRPGGARARPGLAWAAGALLVAVTLAGQASSLTSVRGPAGHGEDIRPALAAANSPAYRNLPIVISTGLKATELGAYDRADLARAVNLSEQHDLEVVWPSPVPRSRRLRMLDRSSRFVLLLRSSSGQPCASPGTLTSAPHVLSCMKVGWLNRVYRVVAARAGGRDWSFSVLART